MSRRIITKAPQAGGDGEVEISSYADKVVGFIPGDVVAAYTTAAGLISAAQGVSQATLLWIVAAGGLLFTAFWTNQQTKKKGKPTAVWQIIISTAAFAVWVFALGGPFATLKWYNQVYGSLLLIGYTLAVPLIPFEQE